MALKDWSTVAASNTSIGGISIAEGMSPANVNNAIREMMAQLATWGQGGLANVKDYGGDATGAADSTAAIVAAIAALTSGGVLYFPAGTYLTDAIAMLADKPIWFVGEGMGVTNIKLNGTAADTDDLIHFNSALWSAGTTARGGGIRGVTLNMNSKGRNALRITGWKFGGFSELEVTGMRAAQTAIHLTQATVAVAKVNCREVNGIAFERLLVASDGPAMKLHAIDVGAYADYGSPQITNVAVRASQLASDSSHCFWCLVDSIDDADQSTIGVNRVHVDSSILIAKTDNFDAIRLECDGAAKIATDGDNGVIQNIAFSGVQCENTPGGAALAGSYGLHVLTGAGSVGGIAFNGSIEGLGGTVKFLCEEETEGVLGYLSILTEDKNTTSSLRIWDQDDTATSLEIRASVAAGSEREGQITFSDKDGDLHWTVKKTTADELQVYSTALTAGVLTIDEAANVAMGPAAGTGGALATAATDGFLYIRSCAGTPTGVPTAHTGRVPIVYDSTNNKLYVYDGGWIGVGVS